MNPTSPFDTFKLNGRRALVTGASSGLCRHFTLVLAAAGAEVTLAARQISQLEQTAEQIRDAGGTALTVAIDVTDRVSVTAALDAIDTPISWSTTPGTPTPAGHWRSVMTTGSQWSIPISMAPGSSPRKLRDEWPPSARAAASSM